MRLESRGRKEGRETFGDFPGGIDGVLGSEGLSKGVSGHYNIKFAPGVALTTAGQLELSETMQQYAGKL